MLSANIGMIRAFKIVEPTFTIPKIPVSGSGILTISRITAAHQKMVNNNSCFFLLCSFYLTNS
jgi:hypothetical protein